MNVHAFSGYNAVAPPSTDLFGAQGSDATTSSLYLIDPLTGAATSIGPIGFALTGLAMRPSDNVMFGVTSNNSASNPISLVTVDTNTGAGTLVGSLGTSSALADITFRSDSVLYGFHSSTYRLYTVDTTTGAATFVNLNQIPGSPPHRGIGCTFDSSDVLYVFPDGDTGPYYSVDETAVTFTSPGTLSGFSITSGRVSAAACASNGVIYGTLIPPSPSTDDAHLVTINTGSGTVSDVGVTLSKIDALAFSLV